MKKLNSLISLLIIFILFTGCSSNKIKSNSSAEEILNISQKNSILNSANIDISTNVALSLNNEPFNIYLNNSSEFIRDKEQSKIKSSIKINNTEQISYIYLFKKNDKPYYYSLLNNNWSGTEINNDDFLNLMLANSEPILLNEFINSVYNFKEIEETETHYILKGDFSIEQIKDTIDYMNVFSLLESINFSIDAISKNASIPVKLTVNKETGISDSVSFNLINTINEDLKEALKASINNVDKNTKFDVKEFNINLNLTNINSLSSIEIPKDIAN